MNNERDAHMRAEGQLPQHCFELWWVRMCNFLQYIDVKCVEPSSIQMYTVATTVLPAIAQNDVNNQQYKLSGTILSLYI
jgi:hypothetical protein